MTLTVEKVQAFVDWVSKQAGIENHTYEVYRSQPAQQYTIEEARVCYNSTGRSMFFDAFLDLLKRHQEKHHLSAALQHPSTYTMPCMNVAKEACETLTRMVATNSDDRTTMAIGGPHILEGALDALEQVRHQARTIMGVEV